MPATGVQVVFATATAFAIGLVVVPAILWGVSVGVSVLAGKWRSLTFLAAVMIGGIGLYIGIPGLTFETTPGMYPGEALSAVAAMLGGALLLLIGALTGFAALFVRQQRLGGYKPPEVIHYYAWWQSPSSAGDEGGWVRGPDFDHLDAAREWAQDPTHAQGAPVVQIYAVKPTGTELVETIQGLSDSDP